MDEGYISLQYIPPNRENKKDNIYKLLEVIKKRNDDIEFKEETNVIRTTESGMMTLLMSGSLKVEPIDGSLEVDHERGSSIYITRNKKRKKKTKKKKTKKKKLKRKIKSKRKS